CHFLSNRQPRPARSRRKAHDESRGCFCGLCSSNTEPFLAFLLSGAADLGDHSRASLCAVIGVNGGRDWSVPPPPLTTPPPFSSTESTRPRERTLALGTLLLEFSQVVREGREMRARSAISCCDKPARLRAARNMLPVISMIVMSANLTRCWFASM